MKGKINSNYFTWFTLGIFLFVPYVSLYISKSIDEEWFGRVMGFTIVSFFGPLVLLYIAISLKKGMKILKGKNQIRLVFVMMISAFISSILMLYYSTIPQIKDLSYLKDKGYLEKDGIVLNLDTRGLTLPVKLQHFNLEGEDNSSVKYTIMYGPLLHVRDEVRIKYLPNTKSVIEVKILSREK